MQLTDYSSGSTAIVNQFSNEGNEVLLMIGSLIYTAIKIWLAFIQANAILFLIIAFFLVLWGVIGYRKRIKRLRWGSL